MLNDKTTRKERQKLWQKDKMTLKDLLTSIALFFVVLAWLYIIALL